MYLIKIEVNDTTESNTSAFYMDLLLWIGREVNFTLPFTTNMSFNFPFLSRNIPSTLNNMKSFSLEC